MQHYELTYIVPMTYTIDELPAIKKAVSATLTDNGAAIVKESSLGKNKFSYPINKLSHGYYEVVEFDMDPANMATVERALQLTDEIVRHLVVTKRIKSEKELAAEQRLREKIAEQEKNRRSIFDEDEDESGDVAPTPKRTKTRKPKTEKAEEKVAIEDLDKKLDAILEGEDMLQ